MILAGDIGGTNSRLGLFADDDLSQAVHLETYPSEEYKAFRPIVAKFRATYPQPIRAACFGVAGPVKAGRSETVNLPWVVDAAELQTELGLPSVWVINDLESTAYGIAELGDDDVVVLNQGAKGATGNVAVIAAGTGLGESGLFWDGDQHQPFSTEGGHCSFAPGDDTEVALLQWLQKQFGHVSWERVVSGQGLVNVYRFLRDSGRGEEPAWLTTELAQGDDAAVIAKAAAAGKSALCQAAMDRFCRLYGAEAGNLALKVMATGGVYVGGGIAPKNIAALQAGSFLAGFLDKGRMRELVAAIPVKVVMNQFTGLRGAARCAKLRSAQAGA